jgi:hypothetical protein
MTASCDDQDPSFEVGQGQAGVPAVDDPWREAWEGHRVHRAPQGCAGLRSIYAPTLAELEARLLELHLKRERHGR